jgi:hypothetical protein
LKEKGNIISFGIAPVKIDIINEADGIDINNCYSKREIIIVEDVEIPLISKEDLIANKKSTGRLSDMADVEKLEYEKNKNVH